MNRTDASHVGESASVGCSVNTCDQAHWQVRGKLEKYWAGIEDVRAGLVEPYEVVCTTGNVLTRGGADAMWLGLIGSLTATSGQQGTYFNNGNASIGVGNSTAAAVNTQTALQANSSRRYFKGMEATFPTHTTGTASTGTLNIVFKSLFSTAQANFAWQEWGVRNSTLSTGAGRLLNRKVQSLGTKSTAATWALTVTLSLA